MAEGLLLVYGLPRLDNALPLDIALPNVSTETPPTYPWYTYRTCFPRPGEHHALPQGHLRGWGFVLPQAPPPPQWACQSAPLFHNVPYAPTPLFLSTLPGTPYGAGSCVRSGCASCMASLRITS